MKKPMLKQVALSMTPKGVIGVGDRLFVTSSTDFSAFVNFTKNTVMIVGMKTARQMFDAGVTPSRKRPMLVVMTRDGLPNWFKTDTSPYIYFAKEFNAETLALAESIAQQNDNDGWTVCGGKGIYEAFFDLVDKGTSRVNRALVNVALVEPDSTLKDVITLNRDPAQVRAAFNARMAACKATTVKAGFECKIATTNTHKDAVAIVDNHSTIYEDTNQYDSSDFSIDNSVLTIENVDGAFTAIPFFKIESVESSEHRNELSITLESGRKMNIRMKSPGALNALKLQTIRAIKS